MSNIQYKYILAFGLLLCLFPFMPYGYFQLIRLVGSLAFAYFALKEIEAKKSRQMVVIVMALAALLLQPLYKIHLPRLLWNWIDVGLAIFLIVTAKEKK